MWLTFAPILLSAPAHPAAPSLYAVEEVTVEGKRGIVTRSLVRIVPGRDGRLSKVTLVSRDQRFFGHVGRHRIVADRFIVTKYGGVIDLATNLVVNDEAGGELLGVEGGKVVYRITDDRRESGVFAFDLKASRVEKLADTGRWELPGVVAPDGRKSIEAKPDGTVTLHTLGGTAKEIGRDYVYERSSAASLVEAVPCLWLDDSHVLTQKMNGKLVVLDATGGSERLPEIAGLDPDDVFSPPRLRFDAEHRVVYSCGGNYFLIDVVKKQWSRMEWYALGHGFEAAVATDENGVCRVRHGGKDIGGWVVNPYEATTSAGRIAFPYKEPSPPFVRVQLQPQGVALWDAATGQWQTVKFWPNSLIGWAAVEAKKPD